MLHFVNQPQTWIIHRLIHDVREPRQALQGLQESAPLSLLAIVREGGDALPCLLDGL